MRLLDRILRRETRAADPIGDNWLALLGFGRTSSAGVTVSRDGALMVPACSRAVRLIAETVATLPTIINRRLDGGGQERASDHPGYPLVHDDANDWSSAYDLKLRVTIDMLTHDKGGFAYINRVAGRPVELLHLSPDAVSVTYGPGGEPSYRLHEAGAFRDVDRRDVIHVRSFGHVDKCPLTLAVESIGLGIAQQRFAGKLMANGAKPSSLLIMKETMTDPKAMANLLAMVKAQATGENEGSTIVIPAAAEFEPNGFTPEALELLDSRRFIVEEVARAFAVPPHLLFEMGRATWGNAAEMGASWLKFGLLPILEAWHGAIRRTLLTSDERRTHAVETLVDDLVRADLAARMNAYSVAIAARVLNPNEARAMEGRPPFDGGDIFANPHTTSGGSPNVP